MQTLGRPGAFGVEALGISGQERQFWNLQNDELIQKVIETGECIVTPEHVIIANTGKFTGRSPKDKYIADYQSEYDSQIDWGKTNQPIAPEKVTSILSDMNAYLKGKDIYIQDLQAGHHPKFGKTIRIITEKAWHSLFSRNLFICDFEPGQTGPDFTIVQAPGFFADKDKYGLHSGTFIILDFGKHLILIGGTAYGGEIKKSVFSYLNRILPEYGILPMHCSANIGQDGDTALFFGLSGTGKTTLSSDPERRLIGDDEHGWGDDGIFNFEDGCYAKTINLKRECEPLIWEACHRRNVVLENVVYDEKTNRIDFDDGSITENTRAAYPLEDIANYVKSGMGSHPRNIFFLSADAFGVLPPIALLNEEQAMYYFLSGFTAKLAGTELGLGRGPQATFSSCFGAPFLPLHPKAYTELLGQRIRQHETRVWLVNTGWSGGSYGTGERIKLAYTRALIKAALNGELHSGDMFNEPFFGLRIPKECPDVPPDLLNPAESWVDQAEYIRVAESLRLAFDENHKCLEQERLTQNGE